MKPTTRKIMLIIISLSFILFSCEEELNESSINTQEKANELVGEINYLVYSNFPSSYSSWSLSNKTFQGEVSGICTIDGSYSQTSNEGWSTYSYYYTYDNVYISFDQYQDRNDYPMVVTGDFNLDGSISSSGSIGGSSTDAGSHVLLGIFSVTGKFNEEDIELYLVTYSNSGLDYSAILKVGNKEWEVN